MLRRLPTLLLMCLGAALLAQAPEFAQQYRQRLGGALDELRVVTQDFERDAARSRLSRGDALERMTASPDAFVHDRGLSMGRTLARFERLSSQHAALERADPFMRPVEMVRGGDRAVLRAAWDTFEPAVPLTGPGLVWGALGALLFGTAGALAGRILRPRRRNGFQRA